MNVAGAILNQNGNWRTASDCGNDGSRLTPADSTLNTFGSTASVVLRAEAGVSYALAVGSDADVAGVLELAIEVAQPP